MKSLDHTRIYNWYIRALRGAAAKEVEELRLNRAEHNALQAEHDSLQIQRGYRKLVAAAGINRAPYFTRDDICSITSPYLLRGAQERDRHPEDESFQELAFIEAGSACRQLPSECPQQLAPRNIAR